MKKIIFISATSNTNFTLSKKIATFIDKNSFYTKIVNLEDFNLPLYNPSTFKHDKNNNINRITELTDIMVSAHGYIICAPEYNGNVPPVISNAIAWVSSSTDYWKDAFKNKNAFIASSSGGNAEKFQLSLRNQLTHIGSKVFDKTIIINDKNKLDDDVARKDINAFIKLL